jgi:hypothetical protein
MAHELQAGTAMTVDTLLQRWLDQRLDPDAAQWLGEALASVSKVGADRDLYRCVSLVSRKLGKAPLGLDAAALGDAAQARPGWDPSTWTIDQAARIRLLLAAATAATPSCDAWTSCAQRPTWTNWWPSTAACRSTRIRHDIACARQRVCDRT